MISKVGFYKLENGKYQISHRDSENNRIRKQFKSFRSAKIYSQRVGHEVAIPDNLIKSSKTVGELLQDYIEQNPTSPMKTRARAVYESFNRYFGCMNVEDLNKVLCAHWIEAVKIEMKYCSRTMRTIKYTFSPFFQSLVEQKLIKTNYLGEVYIKLGTRMKQRVFLSESELKEIIEKLKRFSPLTTYPVIYFLMHTGCKISEAVNLEWHQLNLEAGTVYFPRKTTSNARILNISERLLEFLKAHPRTSDNVFLNDQGEAWTVSSFYKCMAEDRSAVGLNRNWDSYSFRHTFAYHFLRKGKTLQQLQVVLGHRCIAQTIEFYGDIVSDGKNVKF
ncbi:MAG: tyrosine-type recombinase/integrase [Pseudobdellovibrio sp.]